VNHSKCSEKEHESEGSGGLYFRIKRKIENYHESELGARWIFSLLTFRTGKGIKQLEKDHNRTRDPFFTHPPKLQACKDNVRIGTEKADRLGEFNDMLVGARPPKVQKARILTFPIKIGHDDRIISFRLLFIFKIKQLRPLQ
jgi:hypothetical protein